MNIVITREGLILKANQLSLFGAGSISRTGKNYLGADARGRAHWRAQEQAPAGSSRKEHPSDVKLAGAYPADGGPTETRKLFRADALAYLEAVRSELAVEGDVGFYEPAPSLGGVAYLDAELATGEKIYVSVEAGRLGPHGIAQSDITLKYRISGDRSGADQYRKPSEPAGSLARQINVDLAERMD